VTKDIRNFCLISHGGAGKTTLTEMMLFNTDQIAETGNVEKGSTRSDYTAVEKDHQYSVTNSYFSFSWKNRLIHLVDTPGYADFRGEVASALRMVESAVLLIDGSSGIEVNTGYVWKSAVKNNLSRAVFINKLDKENSKFDEVVAELENEFDTSLAVMSIPVGKGENYEGIIDLLDEKFYKLENGKETAVDIPESEKDRVEEYRTRLVESVVELDDELMMKYLEDEPISDKELTKAFVKGVEMREVVPVMAGSALKNSGVDRLLDHLVKILPSPDSEKLDEMVSDGSVPEISTDSPFSGLVCKTMVDPYIGKLSIFRVISGTLSRDDIVHIPRINDEIKVTKLYKMNGSEQETVELLSAGEIGAVAKLDELETADTIRNPELDVVYKDIDFPKPMYTKASYAADNNDEEKMASALQRYSQSDPTFKVEYNKTTKELLITGMGTVHFAVVKDECKRKFDVEFETSDPKVAYKETIQSKTDVEEKYKKQSGGRGQYGHVLIKIEPLSRGKSFEFEEEIFGGAIPSQYIPAVEKGIVESMNKGVLAGYPVVDFKVVLYDGSYHDVDSSEMAFKIAASKAFKKGIAKAKPVLLEPIMEVEVTVPQDFMGDIMGDFNSRRGRILGMDPRDGVQIIKAKVPQAEMFSYAIDLKSITGGYGSFDMKFSHYDKVPSDISDKIISAAQKED